MVTREALLYCYCIVTLHDQSATWYWLVSHVALSFGYLVVRKVECVQLFYLLIFHHQQVLVAAMQVVASEVP